MEKSILLFSCLLVSLFSKSQGLLNGDFETWELKKISNPLASFQYEDVSNWITDNIASSFGADESAKKVTDAYSGKYAVKVQNIAYSAFGSSDSLPGYISTIFKVDSRPSYLNGYYKCHLPIGESAEILVGSKKVGSGDTIGFVGNMLFTGVQDDYVSFSIPLYNSFYLDYDSLSIEVATYELFNYPNHLSLETFIQLDNLTLSETPLSLEDDFINSRGIIVSPNPSSGVFIIQNSLGAIQKIGVTNMSGETVYTSSNQVGNYSLDLSECPRGTYIVHTQMGTKIYSKKIVLK